MPDPKHTINPETGKPIGEDRLDPFDHKVPYEVIEKPFEETGGPEDEIGLVDPPRPTRDGIFTIVDPTKPGAKEAMRRALFDS